VGQSACLDERTVVAFLEGTVSDDSRSAVEAHLAACSACAELTTWAAAELAHGSRAPGDEGRPFIGALAPGARVDRYQILGGVGRGGMGEVYAAYHPDLDRRIALKVVSAMGANAPERRSRLLREARAIARLSHPNVVAVHDAGTVADRVYIAMEFVDGETVEAWMRAKARNWREIMDVFVAAGRGLAAAHNAGIVHRDFKPQNVMIGRDGSVRVMDFGLARLAEEPVEASEDRIDADPRPRPTTVTKTGALVGTVAYMAPEQFRGEPLDARADQFSFCVAFYEALYGSRPVLAHVQAADGQGAKAGRTASVPGWLRATVSRGLNVRREQRFSSMDDLIRALESGRQGPKRRALMAGAALTVALVALGGWRVARGGHISCAVPAARLGAAWSGRDDARRQSIHRAFAASGRATAETSWQRVARVLDDYIGQWSAMYVGTCEATHVRGEQSSEVLDLRMTCLGDNLDQVRALTNILASADGTTLGRAVAAVHDLTPVPRCADVALLRSAVALPRDQRTLEAVRELRSSLREAQALRDVANFHEARKRAVALVPRVQATGYGPLLAELLELIGSTSMLTEEPASSEATLHEALFTAEAARDDVTAARAAIALIYLAGVFLNRPQEAEMWMRLSEAILDRLGPGHERVRAWAANNFAGALWMTGDFERAVRFARQAIALKEQVMGKHHPDVALSWGTLSSILQEQGQPLGALESSDRALDILSRNGDPESDQFASEQTTRGEALVDLGRGSEAEAAFTFALHIHERHGDRADRMRSFALQGIGNARLIQGAPAAAIPALEEALRIREAREPVKILVAETRFSLARALWESGRDRTRAVRLGVQAKTVFSTHRFPRRERAVIQWLAEHKPNARAPAADTFSGRATRAER
jgi:tetratricopeptide (TPR) repeat protein